MSIYLCTIWTMAPYNIWTNGPYNILNYGLHKAAHNYIMHSITNVSGFGEQASCLVDLNRSNIPFNEVPD